MKSRQKTPVKPIVTFGKFSNIDMRVATVVSAPMAQGTQKPCRLFTLDLGHLGMLTSVGQFALIPEGELVGRKLIVCCNLGPKPMGPYVSEALVLGVLHPRSAEDEDQAMPLYVDSGASNGDPVF